MRPSEPAPWPAQAKMLIRRRFARLAAADSFQPDPRAKALAAGCPADWYDALPPRAAGAFSGCGWPGESLPTDRSLTVVELGCGGGLEARYLADRLAPGSRVIALDLTPEVLPRAAATLGEKADRVSLLAGDMERLPLADGIADSVIANASLNLAADKDAALREIYRILGPAGRLVAADLVREGPLPPEILADPMAMATSLGGVVSEDELGSIVANAGFGDIEISNHRPFGPVVAVDLRATRP